MKGSKTLYVSDLDGTLLRHDQTVSPFTAETINTLTARGMLFSYATARSLVTAKTVTKGLNTHFPLIIYNGAFVRDNVTEEILLANYFDASVYAVLDEIFKANIYPIVYANVDGREHFSFIYEKCTPGLKGFAELFHDRADVVIRNFDHQKLHRLQLLAVFFLENNARAARG